MASPTFQPLSMASVFDEIAVLTDDAFRALEQDVTGPNAFDSDRERVQRLALRMEAPREAVGLLLNALSYLYAEIHKKELKGTTIDEVLSSYIEAFDPELDIEQSSKDFDRIAAINFVVARLERLLTKNENATRYLKYLQLTKGPLPLAESFIPIIDLRPIMADDNTRLDQIIPLIQFRVRTSASNGDAKDHVFQMDRRTLNHLSEAVDLAKSMLKVIEDREDISDILTKIHPLNK